MKKSVAALRATVVCLLGISVVLVVALGLRWFVAEVSTDTVLVSYLVFVALCVLALFWVDAYLGHKSRR